jgi:hypothetical protein
MTFTWLGKQGVQSSDGFAVQSVGRFEIEYREGGQVVTVPVERGSFGGGSSVSIPANAFEYWDNYRVPNSQEKQAEMLRNFKAAMAFQEVAVDV